MEEKNTQMINVSFTSFLRAAIVVLGIIVLYIVRDILAVVLFAVVVASAVDPAAQWFMRRRIPRTIGVIIVYLAAFLVLAFAFYIIIPTLLDEVTRFLDNAPTFLHSDFLDGLNTVVPILPGSISNIAQGLLTQFQGTLSGVTVGFFGAASHAFGSVVSFLLIIVLSFYLSVQEKGIENLLRIVTPRKHERYLLDLWTRSRKKIGRWLQGQILLGVLVGVLVFLGLSIMRIKFAFLLALLAAIFELIPIFGPVLSAIPAIAIAFLQSPALGFVVLIFYVVVQQFENHLIYPVVVRHTTGVPAIVVVLALIVGGKLGGFFGLLLAIPVAVVLIEFLNDIALRKREPEAITVAPGEQ